MARKADTPCRGCGELLYTGRGSAPQPLCHPCRRRNPQRATPPSTWRPGELLECDRCSKPFEQASPNQRYCGPQCRDKGIIKHERTTYAALSTQGRCGGYRLGPDPLVKVHCTITKYGLTVRCEACYSPLPATQGYAECRDCGFRIRAAQGHFERYTLPRDTPPPTPPHPCYICSTPTTNKACCSYQCSKERNNRKTRDRYRVAVGLPVDPNQPTSKWVPTQGT